MVITDFLSHPGPIFDVRAPLEYEQGHIPGAISFPLFTNEERALVGTCYKKQGKFAAIELGVKLVGPKLFDMLQEAKKHIAFQDPVRVYCWRGGMRSGFVSWFLGMNGYKPVTLQKGYKAFRRFVQSSFLKSYQFEVIGGFTGSGKTELLDVLKEKGHQVLDLEAYAKHRGSAFGLAPQDKQPSNEQFENILGIELLKLDINKPIYVEDESRQIGSVVIPQLLFETIKKAPLLFVDVPQEERVEHILKLYGSFPKEHLQACCEKLTKRLGLERTKEALQFIKEGNLAQAVRLLLVYYDATYTYSLGRHKRMVTHTTKESFYTS